MTPVAIVTGASRGIGRGIAECLAEAGYDLVINYHSNQAAAEAVAEAVRSRGRRAETCRADVSQIADGRRLVDEALDRFGRLDLLVNNAGIAPRRRSDLLEADAASWDEVLQTNLKGPYFLTQYAAARMIHLKEAGTVDRPRIVVISSISAYTSSPNRGDYCISKAGLSMLTRLFADRLAPHGITVNEVQPGIIQTDMTDAVKDRYDALISEGVTPIRRWGRPKDIGKAVAAIALGYFDFTTGAAFPVDGGFHMRRL